MEIILGIVLAVLCIVCGILILYDCFVDTKSVNLIGKKMGVLYAVMFFIVGIIIFMGMVSALLNGGDFNVHW